MGTATLGYPGGPSIAFRLDPELITATIMSMTDTNECAVDGCHESAKRRGWCGRHYQRWLKHGDPLAVKTRWDEHVLVSLSSCSVDGCDDPVLALRLCSKHYQRQQAHGDPLVVLSPGPSPKPSENYFTQHKQVAAARGRPTCCEHCGTSDQRKTYDWAFNHVGDCKNPDDYLRLCRSCHRHFDETPEKLAQLARARAAKGGGA